MLNRRNFLKTGAAALPVAAGLKSLHPNTGLSEEMLAEAVASGRPTNLVRLPARLGAIDAAGPAWLQQIRRVGQSNMTEHDPAVMNIE